MSRTYRPAVQELELIIGELSAFEREAHEHGDIEKHLETRGMEVMRQLFQCYLNRVSGAEEEQEYVVGPDAEPRRHAWVHKRHLMSVFGRVEVCRLAYSDQGLGSVFPLDAQLNLPLDRYSHGMRERVGEVVAEASYEAAVEHVGRHTGGAVPKRQAEEIARALSVDFEDLYRQRASPERGGSRSSEELVVISVDGKGIVMRHEDLREQTRRRAEQSSHKLESRLSRGEKRNRKRMASVATVYEIAPHQRTAQQIMNPQVARPPAPKPHYKRVWASVERTLAEVLDAAFAEPRRRDPNDQREWVVLVDGLKEQLRQVYAAAKRHGAKVTVILDFVHVLEYLWDVAWCLHEEGDPKAERWVREHAIAILHGKSSTVAAGMRRSATRRGLSEAGRAPLDRCAGYLLNNRKHLGYASALEHGWPIATGVVEGACRHLVKRRMEVSGARWSLNGAEAVLRLRALRMSGDWDEYLGFHNRAERRRNYPESYVSLLEAA